MIEELTSQGYTFVVASGDDGARHELGNCSRFDETVFASPYAVVVGATNWDKREMTSSDTYNISERACSCGQTSSSSSAPSTITTGGGFSYVYTDPSLFEWQSNVTAAYFTRVADDLPKSSTYRRDGRGYPDVSLLGHNYAIVDDEKTLHVDGTSAYVHVLDPSFVLRSKNLTLSTTTSTNVRGSTRQVDTRLCWNARTAPRSYYSGRRYVPTGLDQPHTLRTASNDPRRVYGCRERQQ